MAAIDYVKALWSEHIDAETNCHFAGDIFKIISW